MCFAAWFAKRQLIGILLPFAVGLAAVMIYIPTGTPRFTSVPPGDYTVLGSKIEVNVAIWVLLDDNKNPGEPRYYRLKYTNETADQLQGAKDATQGTGQNPHARIDGEGGAEFDGPPPVTGYEIKTAEHPAISIP